MKLPEDTYLDYERVNHHKSMLCDAIRTDLFRKAIKEVVNDKLSVVDLGSGTGILSFFASQAGAKHVSSIERTGIIEVAKKLAKENNFENINFLNSDSKDIVLAEQCDVLISECLGYMVLQENMVSDFFSFRNKWLKNTGITIPRSAQIYLVPVEESQVFNANLGFWNNVGNRYGLDFSCLTNIAANSTYRYYFNPTSFISEPQMIKSIDFLEDEKATLETNVEFKIQRNSLFHGMCGYFTSQLSPNVTLDTSPFAGKTHWQQEFYPCYKPILLQKGDVLEFQIISELKFAMVDWQWQIKINGEVIEKHSTLDGIRVKESLRKLEVSK